MLRTYICWPVSAQSFQNDIQLVETKGSILIKIKLNSCKSKFCVKVFFSIVLIMRIDISKCIVKKSINMGDCKPSSLLGSTMLGDQEVEK